VRTLGFFGFMLRAQAAGAQVEVPGLAIDIYGCGVNIGRPASVGTALGMADMMTEKRGFPAQIALQFLESPWFL
jgi:hypothetical protein